MSAIYGLYADPDAAQRAVEALRGAGVTEADIMVMSSEPFEDHEFSERHKPTWMFWIAVAGGVLGLTTGYFLTSLTQQAWPLRTSGMPIVAPWPNAIVVFEMTMLGAIAATVVTLLVAARLPRRLPRLYDPAVSDGYILVGVAGATDSQVPALDRALASVPGAQVKTLV